MPMPRYTMLVSETIVDPGTYLVGCDERGSAVFLVVVCLASVIDRNREKILG